MNPTVEPHHLFFGIRDEELPIEFSTVSLVRMLQVLRTAPAYLGAWPKLGLLDLIPLRVQPVPNENGLARLPFGLWQMSTADGFSLVGVDPQVLTRAAAELAVVEDDTEAQLRVHVTDVSQSKIQDLVRRTRLPARLPNVGRQYTSVADRDSAIGSPPRRSPRGDRRSAGRAADLRFGR